MRGWQMGIEEEMLLPGQSDTVSGRTDLPERAYWVAFHRVPFIGPARLRRLQETFGTLSDAWHAPEPDLKRCLEDRPRAELVSARKTLDVAGIFDQIVAQGVKIATPVDLWYPILLSEIPAPPPVLYYRGELLETDRTAVAIVGTRRVSAYGRDMAARLAADLARAGVTIVSGLARGVDGVAHQAALDAGGRTIAVLGSGINRLYPPEHRNLAQRIMEQGAVLSDYAPDTPPDGVNFPPRNRIISGLSLGVVVVEAPDRSGALITVDFAADQGRDVFAVPGQVTAANSTGTNRLIREGARLVRSADDLMEDLQIRRNRADAAVQQLLPLSEDERRLLAVLTSMPQHIDDLAELSDSTVAEISGRLMMLELQGLVRNAGAQHYART
jgi:DNA processing protein